MTTMAINDQFPVGLRVLVVDDDVTCLKILDHMLQRCRYRGKNPKFEEMAHRKSVEKELDIGWSYGRMVDNNHRHVQCNYCQKKMYGGITRFKEHLAGIGSDVALCREVPKEVKEKIKAHLLGKKKEKQAANLEKQRIQEELMRKPQYLDSDENSEEDEDQAELRRGMRASRQSMEDGGSGEGSRLPSRSKSYRVQEEGSKLPSRSRSVHIQREIDFGTRNLPTIDSFMQKKGGKSQSSIKTAMKGIKDAKKHIGRAISKFFFYNHIPHNVANSPYYETMIDAIADAGRGVKPPTAWEISNTYLDAEYKEIEEYMKQHEKYWDEYGCTLMCDGWSTQNRRKIINFLVYSTFGTVFIDSIDATDEFQSAEYICSLMNDMVERIGEKRVVQVVTDNGANYKAAGYLLMETRKHLYWTPCAAHCIDLMLEDMAKEEEVKNAIQQCQKITGYIYNHGWLLSMMKKETGQKELIRPAITRFATHFIALDSIHIHRDDLKRMVVSREWINKFPKLSTKDRTTAFRVQTIIQNEAFWNDVASVIVIFEPLVKVLRMVDSDDRAEMGYLYEAMDRAKESIRHSVGRGYRKWWNIIDKRWDKQLHRDIHAAVTTCCKATVALSLLRERRGSFDIVISDVHMPDMNGFKLLELVGLEMDLPVIMMSADGGTNTVMRGIKHGACDYLIKPVRIEELKNIWQHVVRRKRSESRELECSVSTTNSYCNKQVADDVENASAPNDGADGSRKSYKKKRDAKEDEDDGGLDHEDPSSSKKPRVVWSVELHQQFVSAVNQLSIEKAVPKRILELMNVPGLTRENVASHLQHDDINMQKFRLYLKRVSGIAQHQNGLPSSLFMPQEPRMKISSVGRLDFQALAASDQIPTQTLPALHTEFSGPPSGSLAFPSIDLPVLQASRQGPKCISTLREITFGQPPCKFQSNIPKQINPTSVSGENASHISLWPSNHLGIADSIKNHGVAINTPNDNMISVLHQNQSYQLPLESHHGINVQPSCLVVPSVSSNCMNVLQSSLPKTQNSIVVPSQSSSIFRSGNSSIDINPSSSFDSSSRAVEYDLLSAVSNKGPLCVGKTPDGDILNVTMLNGSPGSIASSVASCSARTDSDSGWQLHNSNMNVNPVFGLPVKLPNLCTQDSEQKLGRQSNQSQMKNLGFVGKGTFISSRFAVDEVESPTNDQSIGNTFNSADGDRAKQQLHLEYMDNFQVPKFSSSNFMGVLSK